MKAARFICYGNSIKNLNLSITYKVLGLRRPMNIGERDCLYLVCKIDDAWNICGRACIGEMTEDNPFDEPEKYFTYNMTNIELCEPYEIADLCRMHCGKYWGLMFQRPELIKSEALLEELEKKFVISSEQKPEKYIRKIGG